MKKIFSFVILCCVSFSLFAQLTDSNLPIVIINTDNGVDIPDAPRVSASMKIIYRGPGERNFVSDQNDVTKLNYNGKIKIEIRGSSSQSPPKKQYGLTTVLNDNITNNNVELLGMPKENDWILGGLAFDASLVRDYISYNLSRKIGNYAPRQRYCEVVINGDYRGLYILQEKIKMDDNRVDIVKIDPTDNSLPALTGGYLTKADKVTSEDPSAWIMPTYLGSQTDFIHETPKPTAITSSQHTYIKSIFEKLASSASNSSISSGYPSVIDVPSFIDFILINELAANVDAYQFSTYFHKDRNGKLRAGPLWDLNLTYGNDLKMWGLDRSKTNTWQFDNWDNIGPKFWKDLYNNSTFRCYLSKRWNLLTQSGAPLSEEALNIFIDETVTLISEATVREQSRWGTVTNHSGEIATMKDFISDRIVWMTAQLGSFSSCSNVSTPPLVINRIHYHPEKSTQFPIDDDQEFIEILNNSSNPVLLTGIYFSGTGFVYQFPAGETLQANGVIQLANNPATFKQKYGYSPYGEFTRNLSNKSHKLTLADAFGNVIDEVEYVDAAPWPNADGNGFYLKLIDPSLDNNIGENWIASNEAITSTEVVVDAEENGIPNLELYPNPTAEILTISAGIQIESILLRDIQGRTLEFREVNNNATTLDISKYSNGVYLLTINTRDKSVVKKIIKK